ncbi:MAG: FAD-dependent oxidoreductase [Clostridia bacterium]|nr:FAD-dependent oxidoreductase [Clostridia bacterium]
MLDCIIIGSGAAGVSAALTLRANGKSFMLFGSAALSEKISKAERIRNYMGLPNISGEDFCKAVQAQLVEAEITITQEKVSGVYALGDKFGVATQEGGYYESASVILGCGVESVKQIEGETEFVGRGVSYCATCDGFLYKGKTIAVLCTSKRLEHEIGHLCSFADKVYLIAMYKDVEMGDEKVEIIRKMPLKLEGEKRVDKVVFADKTLPVDGVFVLRESVAPTVLVGGLRVENGHIVTTRNMQTNIEGCFAAGDCTGRPYQYAKAAGEGNIAAHAVCAYLSEQKKKA